MKNGNAGRLFDLGAGACLLILSSPVLAATSLAILVFDGPPVLFRQGRQGRHGRLFSLIKFRTLRDGNITRVGTLLRNLGWDELPQLINVLCGEMSLIGPRPLTPEDAARLLQTHPELERRFAVRPGLTGLVQVLGTRGAAFSVRLENAYAEQASFALDMQILALTVGAAVLGKERLRKAVACFPTWKSRLLLETPAHDDK